MIPRTTMKPHNAAIGALVCLISSSLMSGLPPSLARADESISKRLVRALSPAEALRAFQIEDGFRIELVASEPMVQDPVAIAFDEDGRLWVVEMRGFMPNLDREGEDELIGRVSILTDLNHDGIMDHSQVFIDGLFLPRSISIVAGGALIAEQTRLWFVEDSNRDGRPEGKRLVDRDYGVNGSPEHTANGLWRGLDNWLYNAKSRFRYRLIHGQWQRQSTEFRGQWGICHDNDGRLFYNYNWSQLHADLAPPSYLLRNPNYHAISGISVGVATNQTVFPIRPNTAVNRGYVPGSLDEQGRLREFTSAGAPLIYRGDAFPAEYSGNAFVCEPAGNLVKRNIVIDDHGLRLTSRFADEQNEFLASRDERFRPVFLADGPDGALYVVDMYRGVIQHGAHMTPYLLAESAARGLDQPIHLGRIYRIVPRGWKARAPARMSDAGVQDLIASLSDANGWRRDTAQRLLVERSDRSCLPALRELALRGADHLGRLHALWTLEGLADDQPDTLLECVNDPHAKVQAAAIRVLELLSVRYPKLQNRLFDRLARIVSNAPPEVRFQIALTVGNLTGSARLPLLEKLISEHADLPLMRDAVMSSLHGHEFLLFTRLWNAPAWTMDAPGQAVFIEALASAVVFSAHKDHVAHLLSLLDRPFSEAGWREHALLAGLAVHASQRQFKPIPLDQEPGVLTKWNAIEDRAVRARLEKLTRMMEWPGHRVTTEARRNRPLTGTAGKLFVLGRQQYLTVCASCHGTDGAGLERLGPPLLDSAWVLGSPERLVRLVLHGLEGPIDVNGTRYEPPMTLPEMPSLAVLDNESIAAVLTYIRREWDHNSDSVHPGTVSRIRTLTQGRQRPWTQPELERIAAPADPGGE